MKQFFWNTKTFFKKLEYRFLDESTKIGNATFPYKTTDISEANVKTNRMMSTKWTYHKERSFASNYFIFLKNLFHFKRAGQIYLYTPDFLGTQFYLRARPGTQKNGRTKSKSMLTFDREISRNVHFCFFIT